MPRKKVTEALPPEELDSVLTAAAPSDGEGTDTAAAPEDLQPELSEDRSELPDALAEPTEPPLPKETPQDSLLEDPGTADGAPLSLTMPVPEELDPPDPPHTLESGPLAAGEPGDDDSVSSPADDGPADSGDGEDLWGDMQPLPSPDGPADEPVSAPPEDVPAAKPRRATRRRTVPAETSPQQSEPRMPASVPNANILSIDAKAEVETEEYREDTIWHEIRNAYRTRRILTGTLGGVEQTDDGKSLVIVEYKGFRVVIPAKEMMLILGRRPSGNDYIALIRRQNQILSAMMGAEIDFIVRGIDNKTRSIVASRKEAMMKKRQIFYLDQDASGEYRIMPGRLVQARVTAASEKVIRVEAFGVECAILARDLAWDWMGDARDHYSVGDRIVVRILDVQRNSLEDISIRADVKSVSSTTDLDNLKKCRVQGKYAGKVTDVHKGVVFIRLTNGVNAIAHACLDRRMPGKKDDVSFAVTHIDPEQGVAFGIITRIIKQNL